MNRVIWAAALATLVWTAATPAAADQFTGCDGYGAPDRKSDGITRFTSLFGLASGPADVRRAQEAIGASGVISCDVALADVRLVDGFWVRRAHLLQAKGMHQIAAGRFAEALVTLGVSDAVGAPHNDPYFARSVALGNRALRAYALYKLGRNGEARAELDAIDRDRPLSAKLHLLAMSVRLGFETELDAHIAALRAGAPLNPSMVAQLFWLAIYYGDYPAAAKLAPQISFDLPRSRGGWEIKGEETRKYELIVNRAELAGARAYALAATGESEAAKAVIVAARQDVADATQPPPPPAPGHKQKREVASDYQQRYSYGNSATRTLDNWEAAIGVRSHAAGLTLNQLRTEMQTSGARNVPVLSDILALLKPITAEDQRLAAAVLALARERSDQERRQVNAVDFSTLARMLPRPENAGMRPRYRAAGDGFFFGDLNGFYVKKEEDSAYLNVRFASDTAPAPMVEEVGLLASAMEARKAGKDSFLVDSRLLLPRTIRNYYNYQLMSENNAGYEARLRILPVNAGQLPPEVAGAEWRLIRVQDVFDRLYAEYVQPAQ